MAATAMSFLQIPPSQLSHAEDDIMTNALQETIHSFFSGLSYNSFFSCEAKVLFESELSIPRKWPSDLALEDGFLLDVQSDNAPVIASVSEWNASFGEVGLQNALRNLNLFDLDVGLDHLTPAGISQLKRNVKRELKRYDESFLSQFGCAPSRNHKEPLRPLYSFYRRLRTELNGKGITQEVQNTGQKERLEALHAEKASLRVRLADFQEKFLRDRGRKIQYHKDIASVAGEYRRYRNLKEEISRLEEQID